MGKTTVMLNDTLIKDAKKAIGATTNKAAIEAGLQELIKSKARENLRGMIGKGVVDMTPEELDRMRMDD